MEDAIELRCPLDYAFYEAFIDYPADIELLADLPADVHCDNRLLHNHRAAALAGQSADAVADLELSSVHD